jgi:RNA polymerase sigma-70 factor, ECF subfamily
VLELQALRGVAEVGFLHRQISMSQLGAALSLDGVLDRLPEGRPQSARRAVSALFDEVRDPLARYLIHIGIPKDNVEEAVQTAFLKLFEHLLAEGSNTNLRGWVFRVARNNALNELRRGRRFVSTDAVGEHGESRGGGSIGADALGSSEERSYAGQDLESHGFPDHRRLPDQLLLDCERNRRLKSALTLLSPLQRECLHLRAAGMKYREIAEIVRIPTSTVADYLQQALEQLEEECDG